MFMSKPVEIRQGRLVGEQYDSYAVFRGVPYAKAPVGELRWRAPEAPEPWEGVLEAVDFPPKSVQTAPMPEGMGAMQEMPSALGVVDYGKEFYNDPDYTVSESEDCLYLNIWTPNADPGTKLPVAVWIHGGAFQAGTSSEKEFDGAAYCKKGVILVTINYRTGIFGLLCHHELIEEAHTCGNYMLLDQLAALRWVKDNIAAFGGDPDNVTVFGQSAGGMSSMLLSCSPLSEGLFQRAIFQSSGGYKADFYQMISAEDTARYHESLLRKAVGTDKLPELRKIPAEKLFAAVSMASFSEAMSGDSGMPGMVFVPVVDGYVLEHTSDEYAEQQGFGTRPYIIGSTLHDMGYVPGEAPNEGVMTRISQDWAKLHANGPTWVYRMDRAPLGDNAGAFHSAELWYMFGTLDRSWRPKDKADYHLSEQMMTYWTNFMKTGDPNGDTVPAWEPWTEEKPSVRVLNTW